MSSRSCALSEDVWTGQEGQTSSREVGGEELFCSYSRDAAGLRARRWCDSVR